MTVDLMRCSVQPDRRQFMFDQDTYEGWVILSAYSGSFSFEITVPGRGWPRKQGEPAGGPASGECGVGDLVLCPPSTVLRRTITTIPTSFLFVEFRAAVPPAPGLARVRDVQRLRSTYDHISDACRAPTDDFRQEAMVHLVEDLLFLVTKERLSGHQRDDPLMAKVAQALRDRAFSTDLSVAEVAAQSNMSPSRLTRRFRAAYGVTPMAYVTGTRMARAGQLLLETDQTLEAIAARCGYRNSFYFSRAFRQKMGISPSGYRRAHRI